MRIVLLTLAALPLTAASTPPLPGKACARPTSERVRTSEPVRARKLGEMPPGKQLLAVYREVDGCPKPIVVREEVGQLRR